MKKSPITVIGVALINFSMLVFGIISDAETTIIVMILTLVAAFLAGIYVELANIREILSKERKRN